MKKITVINVKSATEVGRHTEPVANEDFHLCKFELEGSEEMEVSDGYHTFGELYEHRIALFITLCRVAREVYNVFGGKDVSQRILPIWRSKLHHDGTSYDGWFVMGIGDEKGEQITYHLPVAKWEETGFAETRGKSPEFDGHTSKDVLERLRTL